MGTVINRMVGVTYILPIPDDRAKNCIIKFHLSHRDLVTIHKKFNEFDTTQLGCISLADFYTQMLHYTKNIFSEVLFEFAEIREKNDKKRTQFIDPNEKITFSEFLHFCCIVCLFDESDMIKFVFYVLDHTKIGRIDKEELKEYVKVLHNRDIPDNLVYGLQAIDTAGNYHDEKPRVVDYQLIMAIHRRFPLLFYPMFQFQMELQRQSHSIVFWRAKRSQLLTYRGTKFPTFKLSGKGGDASIHPNDESGNEILVKQRMGMLKYHLMPWERETVREELKRIAEIEAEMDAKDDQQDPVEINEENLQKLAKFL